MQTYIYFSKIKCFLCASIVPHCAKMHRNPKRATEGLFILVIYIYILLRFWCQKLLNFFDIFYGYGLPFNTFSTISRPNDEVWS